MATKANPRVPCVFLFSGIVLFGLFHFTHIYKPLLEDVSEEISERKGFNSDMSKPTLMLDGRAGALEQTCRMPDNPTRERELAKAMDGYTGASVRPDDPELIEKIRNHFIDLPRPYVTKFSMPIVRTPQAKEVDKVLKGKVMFYTIIRHQLN